MKLSGIDFPSHLLTAVRDRNLVVFAGAGVSTGEPANLPNFKKLVEIVSSRTDRVIFPWDSGTTIEILYSNVLHSHILNRAWVINKM